MMAQFLPECLWQELIKNNLESECHCKCGEVFYSLSCYIGKKTKDVTQKNCPACGSWDMNLVLPPKRKIEIPSLEIKQEEKRKKFRTKRMP
jgi:hypothetical protein